MILTNKLCKSVISLVLAASFLLASTSASASTPDQVVKTTFDKIVANIQANRAVYESDTSELHSMLERDLVPSLNIPFMVDLIIGKKLATSVAQSKKDELAQEFKQLLLKTYATGILYATGEEEVVYEPIDLAPNAYRALVNLKLLTADGGEFPIKLYMTTRKSRWSKETGSAWRAYNLEVAGQDIARLYRATFSATLNADGIDGLIASLRAKNSSS